MNMPVKGLLESRRPSTSKGASKDSTCEPQPFLSTVIDIPPNNSCPPFLALTTACASRIAPAQVPHTGLRVMNSRRGSRRPERRARKAIVVDSVLTNVGQGLIAGVGVGTCLRQE